MEPYWLINVKKGREAHNQFDKYIKNNFNPKRYKTNLSLRVALKDNKLPLDRPDLIDILGNKVWELKPYNYEVYSIFIPKNSRQPEKYVCKLKSQGYEYEAGDVISIIDWHGKDIGDIVVNGKTYKMRLFAGTRPGLILYTLTDPDEDGQGELERSLVRALNRGPASSTAGGLLPWWMYAIP